MEGTLLIGSVTTLFKIFFFDIAGFSFLDQAEIIFFQARFRATLTLRIRVALDVQQQEINTAQKKAVIRLNSEIAKLSKLMQKHIKERKELLKKNKEYISDFLKLLIALLLKSFRYVYILIIRYGSESSAF